MIAVLPALLALAVLVFVMTIPLWRRRRTLLRRPSRRGALVGVTVAALAGVLVASGFVLTRQDGPSRPKAVIVDELALTDENAAFIADTTQQLEAAGYRVDYVPPAKVTVDFYRALPGRGYKMVVLRSHAAEQITRDAGTGSVTTVGDAGLFTGETYSKTSYLPDQYKSVLGVGSIPQVPNNVQWFTVIPQFISGETKGNFGGATVVLMGCAGLKTETLARAFVGKGASQFISWDDAITAEHTDRATAALLHHLLAGQLPPKEAVAQTMAEIGPDPEFGGRLRSYP